MANINASLNLGLDSFRGSSKSYSEVHKLQKEIDDTNAFIELVSISTTKGSGALAGAKAIVLQNNSSHPIEVQLKIQEWKNDSNKDGDNAVDLGGGSTQFRYVSFILAGNDFMYFPNPKWVGYNADASAANATAVANVLPADINSGNKYVDSGATLGEKIEDSLTDFDVSDGDYFKVGDLIQVGINDTTATRIEIMRVTRVLTNNLQVERALNGTLKADGDAQTNATSGAVSGAKVYFPHFNEYNIFDKYTTAQTDSSGRFKVSNFFGYAREADASADGLVPGSVAIKFYSKSYQELATTGVSSASTSGLAASTAYAFNIAIDGGSADTISFTTDSSVTTFGGANGIISKIQAQFDAHFSDSSKNMFQKRVTVGIVGGDIRFTSHSRLKASDVTLAAPGSGTTMFGVGRIPAVTAIGSTKVPTVPNDLLYDRVTGDSKPNAGAFMTDDGHGNLRFSGGSGTINYDTGAIDFTGPANADFLISGIYKSAHSGGTGLVAEKQNVFNSISARCTNSKVNASVTICVYN